MAEIGPEIGSTAGFVIDVESTALRFVAEAGSPPSSSHWRSGRGTLVTGPVVASMLQSRKVPCPSCPDCPGSKATYTLSEAATSWPAPVPPAESGVGEAGDSEAGDSEVRLCEPAALDGAPETALGASETALGASEVSARVVTRPVAKWSIDVFTRVDTRTVAKWSIEVFTRVVTRPVAKWSMRTCHQRSSEPIGDVIRGHPRAFEGI